MRHTARLAGLALRAFLLLLLAASAPLFAYTIYLKDGSKFEARDKYKEQGDLALITLPSGAQTTLPLAQIDVARTKATNASEFGSATVMRGPGAASTPPAAATQRRPTLGELAAQRRVQAAPSQPQRGSTAPAAARTPEPRTAAEPSHGDFGKTPAGYVDFLRAPRTQVAPVELATTLVGFLRSHGVQSAGIYQGSQPGRLLVEVSVNSEGAVFQAIVATAQSLLEFEAKRPRAVDALELFLATDRRARAGQFLMTPERAQELMSKQIDVTAFYLKYVEF